jgi:Fic family protein
MTKETVNSSHRAGTYVKQLTGYRAFIPAPLPPDPPLRKDQELERLLSSADQALGRLDGAGALLPDADQFVAMYVRQEAVMSSQIEGKLSTLQDVITHESGGDAPQDVREVVNYVSALNHGLALFEKLPLSLRMIREIHRVLMDGSDRTPGDFRTTQNWIGAPGSNLNTATFVPPPPHEMMQALGDFEKFLHQRDMPVLLHCALAHAQFETIHPFLDGNGRVGRLLITLLLCERGVLRRPLLYFSRYLLSNRAEYYRRLSGIRHEDGWESWVKFFLRGVEEVSRDATETAQAILELRERHRALVIKSGLDMNGLALLDQLFRQPVVSVRQVAGHVGCTFTTASTLVDAFERLDLLHEITGKKRNRRYRYTSYFDLFEANP